MNAGDIVLIVVDDAIGHTAAIVARVDDGTATIVRQGPRDSALEPGEQQIGRIFIARIPADTSMPEWAEHDHADRTRVVHMIRGRGGLLDVIDAELRRRPKPTRAETLVLAGLALDLAAMADAFGGIQSKPRRAGARR